MKLTVSQLLRLAYKGIDEAAPEGLKKSRMKTKLGQLILNSGSYGEYRVDIPKPSLSQEGVEALLKIKGPGWARKGCNCK